MNTNHKSNTNINRLGQIFSAVKFKGLSPVRAAGETFMKYLKLRTKMALTIGFAFLIVSGVVVYAAIIPIILATGTSPDNSLTGGAATVTFRQLTTTPGDLGAWHYHPGYVHNVVSSGTIKVEDGCGGSSDYSAGQAFETTQGRVHRAINEGAVDAVEYNVFIREQGKPLTRFIPNNEKRCGPVATVDECKGGGWRKFDFPNTFNSQGACIVFVNQRPKIELLVPLDPLQ